MSWFSRGIVLVCLLLLSWQLYQHGGYFLRHERWGWSLFGILFFASLLYAVICTLLGMGWIALLRGLGDRTLASQLYVIYTKSHIAKFLPGNIFHYAGRFALGRLAGVAHAHTTLASMGELASLGLMAILLMLFTLPRPLVLQHDAFTWAAGLFLGLLLLTTLLILSWCRQGWVVRFFENRLGMQFTVPCGYPILLGGLGAAMGHLLFFIAVGALTLWLANQLGGAAELWPQVLGIYALSWLLGTATPGSPGGVGVREVVLVAALSQMMGEPQALMLALMLRVVTTVGDFGFWAGGLLVERVNTAVPVNTMRSHRDM
ncbi:conserved hypothetical protein [Magnetococcus marinus MC-1]|uniref:Uncharacterized protein n=1 Tax=Magnetococcus marinus (strain ATCC BAA-1437 / JCM 17883 / MC-1) TaxID=156889 RepID=A0L925_MAGMM|nr:lysylphosphatidylglycerol synthase domain-containing protein [Magnetococcus marinus]ABK44468.1 conserved hypothetical protein [Magnetococcus marinus MC-1]